MLLPKIGKSALKWQEQDYFMFEDNVFSMVSKLMSQLTTGHFQQENNQKKKKPNLNRNKHL